MKNRRRNRKRSPGTGIVVASIGLVVSLGCWSNSQNTQLNPTDSAKTSETNKNSDQTTSPAAQIDPQRKIQDWGSVDDLQETVAIFETVFWEPRDTISMRKMIRETDRVNGKKVMEIGTGSGLISLCSLAAGADSVVATDVNPAAIDNATFNARRMGWENKLETRLVSLENSGAFAVIGDEEKFDLIFSNPPWEDDEPKTINEYALYDPGFRLIDSLLKDLKLHLNPGGRAYLAYGCVSAIKVIEKLGKKYKLKVKILDERTLEDLDEVFLPGMMLEISPDWEVEEGGK
jgi:methylase of polypeptide subunit release factors